MRAQAAVLHVNSGSPDSTSPTMRIARYVADRLAVPLICNQETAKLHAKTKFDVLFVKYGMLKFSQHRFQAVDIHESAGRVVNLENDYTFVPDKRFRAADETWSTVENRTRLINWNVLTRHPVARWQGPPGPLPEPEHEGLIYYGAHRPDRVPSFKRYFGRRKYPLTVSTFRGRKWFKDYGIADKNIIGAFRDPDAMTKWQATLYIEDEASHALYCSPATRFYECVMAGLPQYVDHLAVGTLTKAGIEVPDEFTVHNAADLADKLTRWRDVGVKQRAMWFKNYGADLNKQFDAAAKGLFK